MIETNAVVVAVAGVILFWLLFRISRQLDAIWMLLYDRLPPGPGEDD